MSASSVRIPNLLGLLGAAVLLPWPKGSKGYPKRWKHLRLTDMNAESYRAKLEKAGNIGVALGAVSRGLVTIDLDEDTYVETFLAENPLLRGTLQTRAARGCNIWVRCSGEYPPTRKLKNSSGDEIGEWRADGTQTIVAGTHPEGMPYQFVVEKPVITIGYEAIIWPSSIWPPSPVTHAPAKESKRVKGVGEQEVVGVSVCVGNVSLEKVFNAGDLISQIAPKGEHRNNASLFDLGRLVRSYESLIGRLATKAELVCFFDRWCQFARPFWRSELTREDYWTEFLQCYHYARFGLDQDPVEVAFNRARTMPLPEVTGYSDERVRLLAAVCREMQQLVTDGSFYLPTVKLGQRLDAHWTSVARWLVAFEALGIIHLAPGEVRKRGGKRSPRYLYGPKPLSQPLGLASLADQCRYLLPQPKPGKEAEVKEEIGF
jgi:bifunctional DNA primase/polymerase-like protein